MTPIFNQWIFYPFSLRCQPHPRPTQPYLAPPVSFPLVNLPGQSRQVPNSGFVLPRVPVRWIVSGTKSSWGLGNKLSNLQRWSYSKVSWSSLPDWVQWSSANTLQSQALPVPESCWDKSWPNEAEDKRKFLNQTRLGGVHKRKGWGGDTITVWKSS